MGADVKRYQFSAPLESRKRQSMPRALETLAVDWPEVRVPNRFTNAQYKRRSTIDGIRSKYGFWRRKRWQ